MSNHEQPTPSHPKSDVRNTAGKNKQTPQGFGRTTSVVDLEELSGEQHNEKLTTDQWQKYEYEQRKNQRILSLGQCRQEDRGALAARATILASLPD
ncbi:hypothetical protein Tco_0579335 [Tanacetum coccineum]